MASRTPPSDALAVWLAGQRWFAGKSSRIEALSVEDAIPVAGALVSIAAVRLADGTTDRYVMPLYAGPEPRDALEDGAVGRALLDVVARGGQVAGAHGALVGRPTAVFPAALPATLGVRRLGGEQSNTSIVLGEALVLKQFRRLAVGVNPEEEITRFLTERTKFAHTPRLAGSLEYRTPTGETATIAVVQELVAGGRDGWQWLLDRLGALRARFPGTRGPVPLPADVMPVLTSLRRLGERTGQLHLALASDPRDPAFAPESIDDADLTRWADSVRAQVEAARGAAGGGLPVNVPDVADALAALRGVVRIRHHGDFHLGQTLYVEERDDFAIIDFEGEPLRPLAERRRKHAAVRDVAGMRRSFDYATASVARESDEGWLAGWRAEAVRAFTAGYRDATRGAPFVPAGDAAFEQAVAAFELEKAAYEIVYEANHRPGWLPIPLRGLVSAAAALERSGARARPGSAGVA